MLGLSGAHQGLNISKGSPPPHTKAYHRSFYINIIHKMFTFPFSIDNKLPINCSISKPQYLNVTFIFIVVFVNEPFIFYSIGWGSNMRGLELSGGARESQSDSIWAENSPLQNLL